MSSQMVDPTFLPQLGHDGVDPGEAGPTLCPLGQRLGIPVPGDLNADGVALHLVEAGVVGGRRVEELAPQQLTVERERRGAVLLHLVGLKKTTYCCYGLSKSYYIIKLTCYKNRRTYWQNNDH